MNVRRARWLLTISLMGRFSSAPVGIEDSHHAVNSADGEYLLYRDIVFLRTYEREQFAVQVIASGVFLHQCFLHGCSTAHGQPAIARLWFSAAYTDCPVDYTCGCHCHKVRHTASDKALKDENITLHLQ